MPSLLLQPTVRSLSCPAQRSLHKACLNRVSPSTSLSPGPSQVGSHGCPHPTSGSSADENRDGGKPTRTLSGFPGAVCNLTKAFNVKLQARVGARRSKAVGPSTSLKGALRPAPLLNLRDTLPPFFQEKGERGDGSRLLCAGAQGRKSPGSPRLPRGWLGFKEGKEPLKSCASGSSARAQPERRGSLGTERRQAQFPSPWTRSACADARDPEVQGRFRQVRRPPRPHRRKFRPDACPQALWFLLSSRSPRPGALRHGRLGATLSA